MAINSKREESNPLPPYQDVITELKAVKALLDNFLERGRAEIHKNMWEVEPGVWISNEYGSLSECMSHLRTLLPS